MAKIPIYKGKTLNGNFLVVGKLILENHTYYIENDDIGLKQQIKLKSISTATKKEYNTFVNQFK